jgi:hypothetical protein
MEGLDSAILVYDLSDTFNLLAHIDSCHLDTMDHHYIFLWLDGCLLSDSFNPVSVWYFVRIKSVVG